MQCIAMYDMQYQILSDSNVVCTIMTQPPALFLQLLFLLIWSHTFVILADHYNSCIFSYMLKCAMQYLYKYRIMLRPMPIHPFCVNHHLFWIRGAQGAVAYPSINCVRGSIGFFFSNLMREPGGEKHTCKLHKKSPSWNQTQKLPVVRWLC